MTEALDLRLPGGKTKTLEVEMPVTVQRVMAAVENQWPEVWTKAYPRIYDNQRIGDFHSPKFLAGMIGLNVVGRCLAMGMPEADAVRSSTYDFMMANHLAQFAVPTFFVCRRLGEAIGQTKPPHSIEWHDMQLPFDAAAFMLPKGFLKHSVEGDCVYISYARLKKGEIYPSPYFPGQQYAVFNGSFMIHAGMSSSRQFHYNWPYTPSPMDPKAWPVIELGDLEASMSIDDTKDDTSRFFFPEGLTDEDNFFIRQVAHYVFSLIMLMLARPELVERGQIRKRVVKAGNPPREFWSPNIIGGRYRVEQAKSVTATGSHASPRAHWRRGHWRQQPYGEKNTLRRDTWIEPVLVNAE